MLDRVQQGVRGSVSNEIDLIDLMSKNDLVDRFHRDHHRGEGRCERGFLNRSLSIGDSNWIEF